MKKTLRKYFVPHEGNGFHPHVLHAKRALGYGAFFVALKVFAVIFAAALPLQAFVTPDALIAQREKIVALVNELRLENGLKPLAPAAGLSGSASERAADMSAAQYFSHEGPQGRNLAHFLRQAGYGYYYAGENLAMGFADAQEVVAAWIKSPTHYANLIDKNFTEEGLGLSAGEYEGVPTVFVAQHYALPKREETSPLQSAPPPDDAVATAHLAPDASAPKAAAPVAVKPEESSVKWSDVDTRTKVVAEVATAGPVTAAIAEVGGYKVKLEPVGPDRFAGSATIPEKSDEIFKVVTPPTVEVVAEDGSKASAAVAWEKPKVVSQTPWERYLRANSWLGKSIPLFALIQAVYLLAAAIFSISLAVHIYYEVTRKLRHKWPIWAQSFGFIALIIVLINF